MPNAQKMKFATTEGEAQVVMKFLDPDYLFDDEGEEQDPAEEQVDPETGEPIQVSSAYEEFVNKVNELFDEHLDAFEKAVLAEFPDAKGKVDFIWLGFGQQIEQY